MHDHVTARDQPASGHSGAASGQWFSPVDAPAGAIRVFALPHAGGASVMYREWNDLLPADISLQAVQLPGRQDRRFEPADLTIEPLVESLRDALLAELDDRPFALFGHSMGGLVAYRLALELERAGDPTPILIGAAAWSPEGFTMPTQEKISLPEDELVAWLLSLGSLPPEIYQDPAVMALTMPATRADLTVCANYTDDGARVDCPVIAYTATDDPLMEPGAARSWATRSSAYLGECTFPGGHFFIHDQALPITLDLTRRLRKALVTAS
ncbi:thioesterase II family protein [Streptomyces polygonati]|uniref:Thioesterase II family protein n=1 Tax=Streptomyces polygonati TaxID=1617087 RepID=A0ABV8HMR4_9ACTN